jgi:hypothetical protein
MPASVTFPLLSRPLAGNDQRARLGETPPRERPWRARLNEVVRDDVESQRG